MLPVVEQLAVAGPITLGTDVFESRQQGHQRVEILQAFNVTRLQSSSTWSGHRCLHAIPEILRVRMKASRKYHANPLAQNSCRTVLVVMIEGATHVSHANLYRTRRGG